MPRGRQKRKKKRTRDHRIGVNCNDVEYAKLKKLAELRGVARLGELLRTIALREARAALEAQP